MRPIPELIQAIHDRGGKVTPQRLGIYRTLQADATHPTAETIFERLRVTMPTVSLATVYKTLNELVALGELRRFDVNGVSHFDPTTEPHAEVVCLVCDRVMDVDFVDVPAPPSVPDFHIIGQAQTFYGYCGECKARQRAAS